MSAWLLLVALASAPPPERPNIVYVMADELAYYEVSYMGHPQLQTPRIDQLAREGVKFTRALAGSPVCAPLRATLMTGKHSGHASLHERDRWAKWGLPPGPPGTWPQAAHALPREGQISSQSFRVVSASGESGADGRARFAFDRDPATHWRTGSPSASRPQELVIDLGDEYTVRGLLVQAPPGQETTAAIRRCELYVASDPWSFGSAMASTTLKDVDTPQLVEGDPITGRFVKLRVLSAFGGEMDMAVAEPGILGDR